MAYKSEVSAKNYLSSFMAMLGLVLFCTLPNACVENEITPSDLTLAITIEGADENNPQGIGTGNITCTASAKDATRYAFSFNDGELQESNSGTRNHTVSDLGTNEYTITAVAYSSTGQSISTSQIVSVFKTDEPILIFADEFDVDGPIDSEKWLAETVPPNNGSWHNGESQHYTDRIDNAYVSEGTLKIVAKREDYTFQGSDKQYTSARLNSKFTFTYGRIDVRAKLPTGEGTWPAIWTLGSNFPTVGWPSCGEIDIMEHWGHDATKVSSAIHTVACSGVNGCPDVKLGETVVDDYDTEFHVYSADWQEDRIDFYVDDVLQYTYKPVFLSADNWPFIRDQFILLNVAMGGSWFEIDQGFVESEMEVDWVRVWR